MASVGIIEASAWLTLRRSSRAEVLIAVVTMVLVLSVGVLQALFVAVFLSMADVVRRVANPHDAVQGFVPSIDRFGNVDSHPDAEVIHGIVIYRLDDRIFFANCHRVNGRIWSAISGAPKPVRWLVFDVAGVPDTDSAAQAALLDLKRGLDKAGIGLVFATMRETLRMDLEEGQVLDQIGEDNLFETVEAAVIACLGTDGGRGGRPGMPEAPRPGRRLAGRRIRRRARGTVAWADAGLIEARRHARRRVQAHGRGGGQVEALGPAEDRDPDDVVHGRKHLVGQAVRLVAEHPGDPPRQQALTLGGEQVGRVCGDVGGQWSGSQHPAARRSRAGSRPPRRPAGGTAEPAVARTHLGFVGSTERSDRATPAGPCRVGHPDQGAGVARIGHLMGEDDLAVRP